MLNLFAYRATRPAELKAAADPVGPGNDGHLLAATRDAALTVAAWGVHGGYRGRAAAVRALLPPLHILRFTRAGHPAHPLYLPAHLRPQPWDQATEGAPAGTTISPPDALTPAVVSIANRHGAE